MFDVAELAAVDPHADEAALIEQIAWLERVKSAASAGQARAAAALDTKRRTAEAAAGVPKAKQGRGVAGEVALARRDAPTRGRSAPRPGQSVGARDAPHTGGAGIRRAIGVACHLDRARIGVPGRRGSAPLGCRTVRQRRQARGHGRCADRRGGQGDRRPPGRAGGGRSGGESRGGPHRDHPARARLHDLRDRAVAGRPGGGRVRGAEAFGRYHG